MTPLDVNAPCRTCGADGPFGKDSNTRLGRRYYCKPCDRRKTNKWRSANTSTARKSTRESMRKQRLLYPECVQASYTKWNTTKGQLYRINNREKLRKIANTWRKANPERIKELRLIRRAANYAQWRERERVWENNRRARKINARGQSTKNQITARIEFFGGLCAYCKAPFAHLDHVISLSRGGTGWPANLRPACAKCNLSKHTHVWKRVLL